MKRSYMVAVQLTIRPTIYIEVVADNAQDAAAQIKSDLDTLVSTHAKAFLNEAKSDLQDASTDQLRIIPAGRASQYHSEHECKLCRSLKVQETKNARLLKRIEKGFLDECSEVTHPEATYDYDMINDLAKSYQDSYPKIEGLYDRLVNLALGRRYQCTL